MRETTSFEYDANGNQARRLQGGVETDFYYDVRDKLVEVDHGGTLLEAYLYDYQGFRVRKSDGDGIVRNCQSIFPKGAFAPGQNFRSNYVLYGR